MRLIEHYLSIQGEGLRCGKVSYFVRFAKCNLRCVWCDTTYSFGQGKEVSLNALSQAIQKSKAQTVCLTGGEPLLHTEDCLTLIKKFPKLHFDIETGGSLDISAVQLSNTSIILDWKLSDSKMNHKMMPKNLLLLRAKQDLIKLVTTGSTTEKKEILELLKKTQSFNVPVSLQAVDGKNLDQLVKWMISLKNQRLQFNLQLHKTIWPGVKKGV